MKRCFFLFIVLSLSCFLFMSCSSTKTSEPQIDLTNIIDPVLTQRPDNSSVTVKAGPILELADVVANSVQYMKAWEMWENYADSLEKTLTVVRDELKNP